MADHTPGPWSVGHIRPAPWNHPSDSLVAPIHVGGWYGGGSRPGNVLAHVYLGGRGAISLAREDVEANAWLIAAAPDLLAALEAITPHAIGHSKPDCKGRNRDPENCEVCKAIWAARDAIAKATGQPSPERPS